MNAFVGPRLTARHQPTASSLTERHRGQRTALRPTERHQGQRTAPRSNQYRGQPNQPYDIQEVDLGLIPPDVFAVTISVK